VSPRWHADHIVCIIAETECVNRLAAGSVRRVPLVFASPMEEVVAAHSKAATREQETSFSVPRKWIVAAVVSVLEFAWSNMFCLLD
jgi:predicted phage gp36 major capsid-like protein